MFLTGTRHRAAANHRLASTTSDTAAEGWTPTSAPPPTDVRAKLKGGRDQKGGLEYRRALLATFLFAGLRIAPSRVRLLVRKHWPGRWIRGSAPNATTRETPQGDCYLAVSTTLLPDTATGSHYRMVDGRASGGAVWLMQRVVRFYWQAY